MIISVLMIYTPILFDSSLFDSSVGDFEFVVVGYCDRSDMPFLKLLMALRIRVRARPEVCKTDQIV